MDYHWVLEAAGAVIAYILKLQNDEHRRRLAAIELVTSGMDAKLHAAMVSSEVGKAQAVSIGERLTKVETNIASIQHDMGVIRELLATIKEKISE